MSRNKFYLGIGLLLIIMPFLGFPLMVKTIIYVALGVIMVVVSVMAHVRRRSEHLANPHDQASV